MALYKYGNYLQHVSIDEFDKLYSPGDRTGWSGIYRCEVCGREVVHTNDKPLPPQNHHQHPQNHPIRWRIIVTDRAA